MRINNKVLATARAGLQIEVVCYPPYFDVSEGARGADIEETITDRNVDAKARLDERIRLSTGRRTAPSSANNNGMVSLP